MTTLKNKIILITGASSGIGEACAHILAQHGAKLLLCARREEKIKNLAKILEDKYAIETFCFKLDVTNAADVKDTMTNLPEKWQAIDVLINNAGLALGLDKLPEGDLEDWGRMIDTNVKGLLYVTQVVLPQMIKRDQGHIINMGSIAGHDEPYAGGTVYCATKSAVTAINQGLKKRFIRHSHSRHRNCTWCS